ncbi:hypothetical protein DH2020_007917 [Rehmannia glutinosa]|uniref:Vacuolar protein sorting-associated protein 45 homolog n=1 Tax=Rehmannia glutinosa TaxID=99300 RepID=A0ABR0TZI7_REHGL
MSKEPMSHLKAVYFLRPTPENIQLMRRQLATPRFGEYHLFFSNMLKDTQLHNLADSDEHEVVQQVQEFYADFVAVDPYHFTFNIASNHMYMLPAVVDPSGLQHLCDRVVDGIAAIFLALKRRPIIRYSRTSDIAKRIAQEASLSCPLTLQKLMYQQESGLFDFRRSEVSPLLLIVDRRDDPVTPLLNQWTYQAMVHELIGIKDNKVDLRNIGKSSKDQQEVVLSSEQDAFFKANMYENFGDIGMNIKKMVDDFQQVAKSNQNIQTIEMSRIVEERKLMLVSQTEQELACNGGQGAAFEVVCVEVRVGVAGTGLDPYPAVTNLLNNENVSDIDRLRLVMLYALRYEKESPVQLMQLFNKLASRSPKYKPGDSNMGFTSDIGFILHMRVENVYTQHQPLLSQTMESIVKGRLRDVDYPYVGNHFQQARPQDVIIFIVGGTTYEEARSVSLQNATNSGIRFILGGSAVLNSKRCKLAVSRILHSSGAGDILGQNCTEA